MIRYSDFTIKEVNEMNDIGFALHRQRGPAHCENYHPAVIGPPDCDCLAEGRRIWLERQETEPVEAFSSRRRIVLE